MAQSQSPEDQYQKLWDDAVTQFEKDNKVALSKHPLAACTTPDALLAKLDGQLTQFKAYTKRAEKLRKALKPILHLIATLSGAASAASSVAAPYSAVAFAAFGVLVQAAENVGKSYDGIIDLCELLFSFLERLRVYISVDLQDATRRILIQILAHILSVFTLVTKEIKNGRVGAYLRALIGRDDVQQALTKLENLIAAEQSIGITQTTVFSQRILGHIYDLVQAHDDAKTVMDKMMKSCQAEHERQLQQLELQLELQLQKLEDIKTTTTDADKEQLQKLEDIKLQLQELKDIKTSTNDTHKEQQQKLEDIKLQLQGLEDIKTSTTETNNVLKNLNQRHLNDSVRSWLNPPDARMNHNDARDLHDKHTGGSLLQSFTYKSWKTTPSSLFWIYGMAGAGKTIICSTIIESLLANSEAATAYFYFYHGDREKQSLRGMLSSVIWQLDHQLPEATSVLYPLSTTLGGQPSINELTACLEKLLIRLAARPIFVALDALDECSKPMELKTVLRLFMSAKAHVLVTGRREVDILGLVQPLATHELDLSSSIDRDISLYLDRVFSEDTRFSSWKPSRKHRVGSYLREHSKGMFQWVRCQLDELSHCLPQDVEKRLVNLPRDLDATYTRILSRIPDARRPHARRLLHWLVFSFRPLHVTELATVLATVFSNDSSATFEEESIVSNVTDEIYRTCLSLVHVTPDGIVQFAHFSIKEFLLSPQMQTIDFKIDSQGDTSHTIIGATCLAYLHWLGRVVEITISYEDLREQYPLASYSLDYAMKHSQVNGVSETLRDMLWQLFTEVSQWNLWVSHHPYGSQIGGLDSRRVFEAWTSSPPPLHWAARFGFLEIVQRLLEDGADANMECGVYGTALNAAVVEGHLEVVEVLAEYVGDLDSPFGAFGTALQAASSQGHLGIVKALIDAGADVNAQGNGYGTAVQIAAFYGQLDVVKHLVRSNARTDVHGGGVKQLLCDSRSVLNFLAYNGDCTVLQAAVLGGWLHVVRYLLSMGIDVDAQGTDCPTPIQTALYGGHVDIAQLLIGKGADVRTQRGNYPTPLQSALYGGHNGIVQLLRVQGAHADVGDNWMDVVQQQNPQLANLDIRKLSYNDLPIGPHPALAVGSANGGNGGGNAPGGAGLFGGRGGRGGDPRGLPGQKGGDAQWSGFRLVGGKGGEGGSSGGDGGDSYSWNVALRGGIIRYGNGCSVPQGGAGGYGDIRGGSGGWGIYLGFTIDNP